MNARTENVLMTLACFFMAYCDIHLRRRLGYRQFDCHWGGFIALVRMEISDNWDFVGEYKVMCEDGFDAVLCITGLFRSAGEAMSWHNTGF